MPPVTQEYDSHQGCECGRLSHTEKVGETCREIFRIFIVIHENATAINFFPTRWPASLSPFDHPTQNYDALLRYNIIAINDIIIFSFGFRWLSSIGIAVYRATGNSIIGHCSYSRRHASQRSTPWQINKDRSSIATIINRVTQSFLPRYLYMIYIYIMKSNKAWHLNWQRYCAIYLRYKKLTYVHTYTLHYYRHQKPNEAMI